jgi:hypothetical protein
VTKKITKGPKLSPRAKIEAPAIVVFVFFVNTLIKVLFLFFFFFGSRGPKPIALSKPLDFDFSAAQSSLLPFTSRAGATNDPACFLAHSA